jgi:hypothetical protein
MRPACFAPSYGASAVNATTNGVAQRFEQIRRDPLVCLIFLR